MYGEQVIGTVPQGDLFSPKPSNGHVEPQFSHVDPSLERQFLCRKARSDGICWIYVFYWSIRMKVRLINAAQDLY